MKSPAYDFWEDAAWEAWERDQRHQLASRLSSPPELTALTYPAAQELVAAMSIESVVEANVENALTNKESQ